MAISGSSSYVSTTRDFLAHWLDANAALPPAAPLTLQPGTGGFPAAVTRANLNNLLEDPATGLIAVRAVVESTRNDLETSAAQLAILKPAISARLTEFNAYVRSWFEGTKWPASLPEVPNPGNDEAKFTKPLDDALAQWEKMNTDVGTPIVLIGDYTFDAFSDDLAALRVAYSAWSTAGQALRMAIQTRRAAEDRIYAVLKKYREVVPLRFAKDTPVYLSLPRLTPLPGHTPAAVVVTGIWDAAEVKAELGWTESTEATLKHYQLRFCSGPDYVNEEEETVATIPKGGLLTYLTAAGLSLPGTTASYKIYVVLESDNEKGSDAVAVTRPA